MSTFPTSDVTSLEDAVAIVETAAALGAVVPAPQGTSVWVVAVPALATTGPGTILGVYTTYQEALTSVAAIAVTDWERRDLLSHRGWLFEPRPWIPRDQYEAYQSARTLTDQTAAAQPFEEMKAQWLSTATSAQIVDGWYQTLALSGNASDHREWITEHHVNDRSASLRP